MSEMAPTPETRQQMRIDRVEWNGSLAEIHDPQGLYEQSQQGKIIIYNRSNFHSPIESAKLTLQPAQTEDGQTAFGISGMVTLDQSRSDLRELIGGIRRRFSPWQPRDLSVDIFKTPIDSIFFIGDVKTCFKALVGIYDEGQVSFTNNRIVKLADRRAAIHAPVVSNPEEGARLLSGAAHLLMRTLDYANGYSAYSNDSNAALRRTYKIGKFVTPVRVANTESARNTSKPTANHAKASTTLTKGEYEIGPPRDNITLNDVGGLESVKDILRDTIALHRRPDIREKLGIEETQGIILHGEPGSGKTMLVHALANELEADLWEVQSSDIYNPYLGESEYALKEMFEHARTLTKPTVLFLDEFDSIFDISQSGSGAGQARNAVAGIFKQEMNTLIRDNPNLFVMAATNNIDGIDKSLIRPGRFQALPVPNPDTASRIEIISGIISKAVIGQAEGGISCYDDDINVVELAQKMEDYSGAEVVMVLREAARRKAVLEARYGRQEPIAHNDIAKAIFEHRTNRHNS